MNIKPTILAVKEFKEAYEGYRLLQVGPVFAIEQQNCYDTSVFAFFDDKDYAHRVFEAIESPADWGNLEREKKIETYQTNDC